MRGGGVPSAPWLESPRSESLLPLESQMSPCRFTRIISSKAEEVLPSKSQISHYYVSDGGFSGCSSNCQRRCERRQVLSIEYSFTAGVVLLPFRLSLWGYHQGMALDAISSRSTSLLHILVHSGWHTMVAHISYIRNIYACNKHKFVKTRIQIDTK